MSEAMTAVVHQTVPILGQMGIMVAESTRGRAVAVLPAEPNRNHVGTTYAGSLFSVAEVLGGLLALETFTLPGYAPIVKSMTIDFLKPALGEVRATAEMSEEEIVRVLAEAEAAGKSNYELVAAVTDENDVTIARTTAQYQLRKFG